MAISPRASSGEGDSAPPNADGELGHAFQRSTPSRGVTRRGRPWEIESTREHLRLNLENWEKQWADVLRYERAKVQDDANKAAVARAAARSGAALALAISVLIPLATDAQALAEYEVGSTNLGTVLSMIFGFTSAVCLGSLWWVGYLVVARARFKKARTRPVLPPKRLDAGQLVASIERLDDPPYYRERDVDAELGFGWKPGVASPPELPE